MSSGAAYGSNFDTPVGDDTSAIIPINALKPQDWYGIAKLYAECRHRSSENFSIVDVRIFNYFSYSQDIYARFFIADIVRSILDNKVLRVSADNMVRDYVGRADFFSLIEAILTSPATNIAIDCYSQAPIDKFSLLDAMKDNFGLRYEIDDDNSAINATGAKPYYYSVNKGASYFGYEPSYTSLLNIQNEVKIISLDIS